MRFINPLPFVEDIGRAKAFYRDVVGLRIEQDHGDFVQFNGGFALHDGASLTGTIFGDVGAAPQQAYGRGNFVLYFETDALKETFERVRVAATVIHGIKVQKWGQFVFRFYDLDGHIVEIGEPMDAQSD